MTTPTVGDRLETLGSDYLPGNTPGSSVLLPSGSTTVYPGCDTTGNHSTPMVRYLRENLGSDYTPGH